TGRRAVPESESNPRERTTICGGDRRRGPCAGRRLPELRPAPCRAPRPLRFRDEPQGRPRPRAGRGAARGHPGVRARAGEGTAALAGGEGDGPVAAADWALRVVRDGLRRVRAMTAGGCRDGALVGLGGAMLGRGPAAPVRVWSGSAADTAVPTGATPAEPRVHEVKSGDTLVKLAERYGVTVAALVAENGMASASVVIRIGQRLVIPLATPASAPRVVAQQGGKGARASVPRAPAHIELGGGFVTIYAPNDRNLVDAGDRVAAGETIATVGRTGRATTDHLHFEIRRLGLTYNPLYLLPLPPRIARVEETDDNPPDE